MKLMDSTKFTNIVLTGAIVVFVIMGIISLNLNYEAIRNQNIILQRQDNAAAFHSAIEASDNEFIKENIIGKENLTKIFNILDRVLDEHKAILIEHNTLISK